MCTVLLVFVPLRLPGVCTAECMLYIVVCATSFRFCVVFMWVKQACTLVQRLVEQYAGFPQSSRQRASPLMSVNTRSMCEQQNSYAFRPSLLSPFPEVGAALSLPRRYHLWGRPRAQLGVHAGERAKGTTVTRSQQVARVAVERAVWFGVTQ